MTVPLAPVGVVPPTILHPVDTARLFPELVRSWGPAVWVYRYTDPTTGWRLSIATCAEPGSGKLSLGGFRIAPESRTTSAGFDSDREAIGLALGMEEKVDWSRLLRVRGPLSQRETSRIVGGKCVMHPTLDARIGAAHDRELLAFAIACFRDVEVRGGFFVITGQDLGHGTMSDGATSSLEYLNAQFKGSVVADTSAPTGEGNYHVVAGMLRGMDVSVERATVGLIGCGNVGMHIVARLRERGTAMLAMDASAARRDELAALGIPVFAPDEKEEFLCRPMDALVVNAAGGSLDQETIERIIANEQLRVVCGSENLVMPDPPTGSDALRAAKRAYAPTEFGGMMGYLTAVEEYLARTAGVPFDVQSVLEAARRLEAPSYEATRLARQQDFAISFEEALRFVCGASQPRRSPATIP